MPNILDGIRVIEWAYYHVGPHAGALLADLGAEVIKIEDTQFGDPLRASPRVQRRALPPGAGDRVYTFEVDNRGKKAIALDLKQEAGREVIYRLVKTADVFLTSMRRPAALSLGLDRATLLQYNPKLIYAHATGFGDKGEMATNPAFDQCGLAMSGILMADRPPSAEPFIPHGIGDQMGGVTTAYGILAALLARERLGIAQEVNTSILSGALWSIILNYYGAMFEGEEQPIFSRQKPAFAISNYYRAKDGKWLVITGAGAPVWWQKLCQMLGLEELTHDPRFRSRIAREDNSEELTRILDQIFAQKDRNEWIKMFKEADYPGAPVLTPLETIQDPQVLANKYIVDYDHPFLGPIKMWGSAVDFSDTPPQVCRPAPSYGEHTNEVLLELGCSPEEIEALRAQRVIK